MDGVQYVRAYHVADGKCVACGAPERQWKPGQVIDAIQAWVAQHNRVPSRYNWHAATPEHPEFQVALRMFGTWGNAIRAAGFEPHGKDAMLYWTVEKILAAMHAYHSQTGAVPTQKMWEKATPERPAALTVRKRFGSWNAAIDAAGFYPRGSWGHRVHEKLPTFERIGLVDGAPIANVIRAEVATGNTLRNLANECGVDESYLSKIVKGKKVLRADYADRILCALDRPHVFAEAAA